MKQFTFYDYLFWSLSVDDAQLFLDLYLNEYSIVSSANSSNLFFYPSTFSCCSHIHSDYHCVNAVALMWNTSAEVFLFFLVILHRCKMYSKKKKKKSIMCYLQDHSLSSYEPLIAL